MELKDTVDLMVSDDYKERMKAEYLQLYIRHSKLKDMLDKWNRGELNFEPTCPKILLELQFNTMTSLLMILTERFGIEGIKF